MQEAEGKLFEISQRNMKKDYTQINPVIQGRRTTCSRSAAARTDGLSGLPSGFHQPGQDDVRMAELRLGNYRSPSGDGVNGFCTFNG